MSYGTSLLLYLQYWILRRHIDIYKHAAVLRAHPLSHIIFHRKAPHCHRNFCTIQLFQFNSTQDFFQDSTLVFLNLFDSRFFMGFDSGFTDSIQLSFPYSIRLTVFDRIQIRFFPIQFDSRLIR